jgi:hypothetical protein
MQSRANFSILVILTALASVAFAQETVTAPEKSVIMTSDPNAAVPSFPYIAEMTGDNVHVRSGPGTNYYSCGKLNKGDRVKVVHHEFGWSCIVPPVGSFSWISTQYVRIDPNNPAIGTVTGDNVRVWVGAEGMRPMYSTECRLKLNSGEKVRLLGVIKDKYHKIAPPTGAYRWVSTEFTKPLGRATHVPVPPIGPIPPQSFLSRLRNSENITLSKSKSKPSVPSRWISRITTKLKRLFLQSQPTKRQARRLAMPTLHSSR